MKTDDLIAMLATGDVAVAAGSAWRRFGGALALGIAIGAVLMLGTLGVRPDIASAAQMPMFWLKLAFALAISLFALLAAARAARPGASFGWLPFALAAPVVMIWIMAADLLIGLPAGERLRAVYGQTWLFCPLLIALLSVPAFIAVLWAMSGLAPTRLRLAGAIAGLLAGGIGATVYSFHCDEMAAPFLATWYVLGMLIPAVAGGLLGPRLLRW